MNTYVNHVADNLSKWSKELEEELQKKYAIDELDFEIHHRYCKFEFHGKDKVKGFVMETGDNFDETLKRFKAQLTPLGKVKAKKKAQLKKLICEFEELD